ncbi:hypothetical protein F5Y09DRAFT_351656 [Xylaria sp. FL1042]|nr:hypothetical protein F5Y09DRAFT_351656 [Xylaria sp. FL1042]
MFALLLFTVLWLLAAVSSHPLLHPKQRCPPIGNGTINIASYQLYPENVDFDEESYIGSLYNASVVVYDPYKASVVSTIEFPNITRTPPFHIGGVAWDPYSDSRDEITILVDAAPAHETAGRDVSGDNYLLRYSATQRRTLWFTNLTALSRGRYGGPQDIEHDSAGNTYVLGTYPGTLMRVSSRTGIASEWFVPSGSNRSGHDAIDHAIAGFTGLAAVKNGDSDSDSSSSTLLLVTDARNHSAAGGALYSFDMSAPKGSPKRVPIAYPDSPGAGGVQVQVNPVIRPGDAIYLPRKYGGAVLLIAEHDAGVSVLRSRLEDDDGSTEGGKYESEEKKGYGEKRKKYEKRNEWRSAEFLGRIPNPPEVTASGGVVTAAVEIAGSVYMVEEWFTDPLVPGMSAGNRTSFPLVDITHQLDALVKAS